MFAQLVTHIDLIQVLFAATVVPSIALLVANVAAVRAPLAARI